MVFEQLKQDKYEFDERLREVKEWASTAIQSLNRGHCGRIRAVTVRDEKRARWKEMFDEDSRRPFFYNQITAKCFQKCIGKPGDRLDKEEQKCLAKCIDRYLDSREVVTSTMVDVGGRPS